MSGYSVGTVTEPTRPGFLRRPVPMWAFLLLVALLLIVFFIPAFLPSPTIVTIKQPLVLTSDSQMITIGPNQNMTLYFTVANLNTTSTITTTANATLTPGNSNVTLTLLGVQTGSSHLVSSSDGKTVSFPPGGNSLVVRVSANSKVGPGSSYTVKVALAR